jgi:lipopolysaccharide export system protein LptC
VAASLPPSQADRGSRESSLLTAAPPVREPPSAARLARRRWFVAIAKRLLPAVALALLSTVALWPELTSDVENSRFSYRRGVAEPESGQMLDPHYNGVDQRGRPYTMTAAVAQQVSPERVNLTDPKGDITLESGNWLLVQARNGVYMQHTAILDLSGDVKMYRDDGTTLTSDSATVDLHLGAAASGAMTHAEGPFGTLDAQGFAVTDHGAVIQFPGPGRLVLNEQRK